MKILDFFPNNILSDPKSVNIRLLNDFELENEDLNLNEIYWKDLSMSKVIISAKITWMNFPRNHNIHIITTLIHIIYEIYSI